MINRGRGPPGRASAGASARGGSSPGVRGLSLAPRVYLPRGRGGHGSVRGGRGRGGPNQTRGGIFMHGQPAAIDPRIADDSDKALVASNRSLSDLGDHPPRPDFGTIGREIKLRTNFFPVQFPQGTTFYEYDVAIEPFVYRGLKRRIYQLAERTTQWIQAGMSLPGRVTHDNNAKLISAYPLTQPLVIPVAYYDEDANGPPLHGGMVYTLTITFIQEMNTGALEKYLSGSIQYRNHNTAPIISALNLILTSLPKRTSIVVGRNRYFSRRAAEALNLGGVEAWKGLCTSVRPVYKQLMINADVCMASFCIPGNLALAMEAFRNASFGARMDNFFRRVRVEATPTGYHRVIRGFAAHTAGTYMFNHPEYGHITMEDYIMRKYNIQLQYPDLELVEFGTANYFPAELCNTLPGQLHRGKLTCQQTVTMSTVAYRPPNVNGETTVRQVRHHLGLDVIRPELQSFGITISPDMAVVPGRILPRPSVVYSSTTHAVIGDRASWNLIGIKFAVGAHLDNWAVLVIKDGGSRGQFTGVADADLHKVVSDFRNMCNASGMHVTADPTYAIAELPHRHPNDPMRDAAIQLIRNTISALERKPTLILIVLANHDAAIYEGVKYLCDVRLGLATACVQSSKIRTRGPGYLASVVLKVNMKLGGVNHRLGSEGEKWLKSTMVVGMDVTHPSPGCPIGCPSIAAVVASVDSDFAQYPATLDIQESRKVRITNLKNMMIDRLKLYQKKNNGELPERILIYRSGLGESQFQLIREEEYPLIMDAFKAFDSYRPKVTIIVCNKSRLVRFYPTEQGDATSDGNAMPGTVVDRGITAIYDFDFFLQSHGSALQGTTRPTRYYIIHDDNTFSADVIQGVTNALCYMFARATRAVSLASPAYYADVACKRGRCYLRHLFHGYVGDGGNGSEENGMQVWEEAQTIWGSGVAGSGLGETMFYL